MDTLRAHTSSDRPSEVGSNGGLMTELPGGWVRGGLGPRLRVGGKA